MASQYCMKCGAALPPGAAFCLSCGTAVSAPLGSQGPLPAGSLPPSAAHSAPSSGPSLGAALGLEGRRNFVVQHQILSMGHSYRVMDAEQHHLFSVQGDVGQNLTGNVLGSLIGGSDSYLGRMAARSVDMTYTLVNAQGAVVGTIRKEGGANSSTFTLLDNAGQRSVVVTLERGMMGGITASAIAADGRPLLRTSGNLVRHNFAISGAGGADVAKVHEAWVAVRDTYNVDILGNIDPLYPLVFTILIDFEKVK